jgi:hypothetical protein
MQKQGGLIYKIFQEKGRERWKDGEMGNGIAPAGLLPPFAFHLPISPYARGSIMKKVTEGQPYRLPGSTVGQRPAMPCFFLDLFTVSIIIRPYSKSAKEQGNV